MHPMFLSPIHVYHTSSHMTIALVALEVVRVDAAIIRDHAHYHLHVASPSESSGYVPMNTSSINKNPSLAGSTIPFTSLSSSTKV